MSSFQPRPNPARRELTRPRRVTGGLRLSASESPGGTSWAAQRWLRLLEQAAPGDAMVAGLEYGRLGQTRSLSIIAGTVNAVIQGRADRPYQVGLAFALFSEEQWERVIGTMAEQAVHAAKLLAGELPTTIEDVFAPSGLRLFPAEPKDITPTCTCREDKSTNPWCKHACCAGFFLADRLASDPRILLQLRGLAIDELIERLRQQRVVVSGVASSATAQAPRVAGASDAPAPALDADLEKFWDAGADLKELATPIDAPPLSHPLLRRLGASPFSGASFPLVGLLATCYDIASEHTIRDEQRLSAGVTGNAPTDDAASMAPPSTGSA